MAPYREPCAARGDPHRLMVVALGAAAGERVAEPEAVFFGNGIGRVGEGRRALVRGDYEVWVVPVMYHHNLGVDDLFAYDVVGHRQKITYEYHITYDAYYLSYI